MQNIVVNQWNVSKLNSPQFGTAKYESVLSKKISKNPDLNLRQIRRYDTRIRGSMPLSWLFRYDSHGADIVHATFQTVAPAGIIHRPKNFVVTVHDLAPIVYKNESRRNISLRLQWRLVPPSLTFADKIIAISKFTKQEISRLTDIPKSKISVIYQGINHDLYQPQSTSTARKRLGLKKDEKYILIVSSSLEHKRIDNAKPVLEYVREQFPNTKLLKVGYGESLSGEHIINAGWVPEKEMPLFYNAADVFLHLSEYEGFGLPVLEAMACGTPIVAREVASIPEIVGKSFKLLEFDANHQRIADAVSAKICLETSDQRAIAHSKQFSWGKTARETVDIYEKLLE